MTQPAGAVAASHAIIEHAVYPLRPARIQLFRSANGNALYESTAYDALRGFSSVMKALPDETTILNFRHWLEEQELTEKLLNTVSAHLKERGLLISKGSMVDATIVQAPSSNKNQAQKRAPGKH